MSSLGCHACHAMACHCHCRCMIGSCCGVHHQCPTSFDGPKGYPPPASDVESDDTCSCSSCNEYLQDCSRDTSLSIDISMSNGSDSTFSSPPTCAQSMLANKDTGEKHEQIFMAAFTMCSTRFLRHVFCKSFRGGRLTEVPPGGGKVL